MNIQHLLYEKYLLCEHAPDRMNLSTKSKIIKKHGTKNRDNTHDSSESALNKLDQHKPKLSQDISAINSTSRDFTDANSSNAWENTKKNTKNVSNMTEDTEPFINVVNKDTVLYVLDKVLKLDSSILTRAADFMDSENQKFSNFGMSFDEVATASSVEEIQSDLEDIKRNESDKIKELVYNAILHIHKLKNNVNSDLKLD